MQVGPGTWSKAQRKMAVSYPYRGMLYDDHEAIRGRGWQVHCAGARAACLYSVCQHACACACARVHACVHVHACACVHACAHACACAHHGVWPHGGMHAGILILKMGDMVAQARVDMVGGVLAGQTSPELCSMCTQRGGITGTDPGACIGQQSAASSQDRT